MQTSDPACQIERIVPASRRPDGSMRKPIRIRAGFRSDGDYQPFKPRVIQERDAAVALSQEQDRFRQERLRQEQERLALQQQQHKTRRKRNKAKKANVEPVDDGLEKITNRLQEVTIEIDPILLGKRLRNLRKRLAKANELHDRCEAGEALSPEELDKIDRRQEMRDEICRIEESILNYNEANAGHKLAP